MLMCVLILWSCSVQSINVHVCIPSGECMCQTSPTLHECVCIFGLHLWPTSQSIICVALGNGVKGAVILGLEII